jgi:hypothetical protein
MIKRVKEDKNDSKKLRRLKGFKLIKRLEMN